MQKSPYQVFMPQVIEQMKHPARYDVDWFIKKFSEIPRNLFGLHEYRVWNSDHTLKLCAMGMCGSHIDNVEREFKTKAVFHTEEGKYLLSLPKIIHKELTVYNVNDCRDDYYIYLFDSVPVLKEIFSQNHPKTRILKMLEMVKEKINEV